MLARHGSVTVGVTLQEAYSKLEMLEHAAQILFRARLLGGGTPLPETEVVRLLRAGGHDPERVLSHSFPEPAHRQPVDISLEKS